MSEDSITLQLRSDIADCLTKIYDLQYRVDVADSEVRRLSHELNELKEENTLLREATQIGIKAMVADKLDFAVRDIRNAVLDGSLGEMSDEDFNIFVDMISNGEILPF